MIINLSKTTLKEAYTAAYVDYIEKLRRRGELTDDTNIEHLPAGKQRHIRMLFLERSKVND